jgi:hypothetical protein
MPTTKLETTIKALEPGFKQMDPKAAVKNIEGWETYLEKHDHEGVKAVGTDLTKLKKLLQADEIDEKAIKTLLHKLGKDTNAVAGSEDTAAAKKIKELGQVLSKA